jgi:hypothetical protein
MPGIKIPVEVDLSQVCSDSEALFALLQKLPRRPARRFYRKWRDLLGHKMQLELAEGMDRSAQANDGSGIPAVVVQVVGVRELIVSAARRADKVGLDGRNRHGFPFVDDGRLALSILSALGKPPSCAGGSK